MPNKKTGRGLLTLRKIIKNDIRFYYRAFLYKDTPLIAKIAMIAVIVYTISPIDIVPDWLIGLGGIDDIAIIVFAAKLIKTLIPEKTQLAINKKFIDAEDTPKKKI